MSSLPGVEVRESGDVVVAGVQGDVDLSNAADIGDQLGASVPNSALGLVVDLTETTYLDSSGVHLLFELAERLRRRQQQLAVVVPEGAPIRRVLRIVELDGAMPVVTTPDLGIERIRNAE